MKTIDKNEWIAERIAFYMNRDGGLRVVDIEQAIATDGSKKIWLVTICGEPVAYADTMQEAIEGRTAVLDISIAARQP